MRVTDERGTYRSIWMVYVREGDVKMRFMEGLRLGGGRKNAVYGGFKSGRET